MSFSATGWKFQVSVADDRFGAGVAHSFTGTAEERDKLLSFKSMFIGRQALFHPHYH